MQKYLFKAKKSFLKINAGEEIFFNVIWFWGVVSYLVTLFVINKLIKLITAQWLAGILAFVVIGYFIWHIFAIYKCKPKEPKLSKIEKKLKRQEEKRQFLKITLEKIFLKRSWTEWNTATVLTAIDLYIITNFLGYIL